jgi:hypothetical protein
MERLIEIEKNTYFPKVEFTAHQRKSKSVIVDGEIYYREWNEEYKFNSLDSFKNGEDEWEKITYDLTFLKHPIISVYDYYGFQSKTILGNITRSSGKLFEQLFNYAFLDYDNPINCKKEYKTRPPKEWQTYNQLSKTIFNKKIIANAYWERRMAYSHYEKNLLAKSLITLTLQEEYCFIDIPLRHFIKLNVCDFNEHYKNSFKINYVGNEKYMEYNFPEKILYEVLTDTEKIKILNDIFKAKMKYKRNN